MFIGHFAAGLAAKKAAPRVSLGTTFLASQASDILGAVLVLAGIERVSVDQFATEFTPLNIEHYPWSHSLVMSLVWSLVALLLVKTLGGSHVESGIVGLVVFSHWILDVITHRPDVPLWFGGPKIGLSLWHSRPGTMTVELALFAAGIWLYTRSTDSKNRKGTWGFWTLIALLLLLYLVIAFAPKPPQDIPPALLVGPNFGLLVLAAWAWWVDRNRMAAHSD